jgi:hypothetical protein
MPGGGGIKKEMLIMLKTTFNFERETDNTLRFKEKAEGAPIIGTLYLKKYAAKNLGYEQGEPLYVTISKEVPEK